MPKVIVYVKAEHWKVLGEDAARVRSLSADAIIREVNEIIRDDRSAREIAGLGAGEPGVASVASAGGLPRDAGPTRSSASPSAAPAPSPGGKRFSGPDLRPSEKKAKR